jgi:tetratricopeptide (TPR) repeat protein
VKQVNSIAHFFPRLCRAAAIIVGIALPAIAEDVVHVRTAAGGNSSRMTGEIVDYSGGELKLRTSSGQVLNIPADRVEHVEFTRVDEQLAADNLMMEGKLAEAVVAYGKAFGAEKRPWARNIILAQIILCHRGLGQFEEACAHFEFLVRGDPTTPYFDLIPLAWQTSEPPPTLVTRAQKWLANNETPAVALMGASWLLATDRRTVAAAVLNRLSTSVDRRVAELAAAQLWRTQVVSATPEQVDRWRRAVRRFPPAVRAGPYYVIGKALARQGRHEQAALAFMRVPILYSGERSLAAESLWGAAGQLKRLGDTTESAALYRELATDFPESPLADAAGAELARQRENGD